MILYARLYTEAAHDLNQIAAIMGEPDRVTDVQLLKIWQRQNHKCAICGRPHTGKQPLIAAHIITPGQRGGRNRPGNIRWVCPKNCGRYAHSPVIEIEPTFWRNTRRPALTFVHINPQVA